MDFHGIKLVGGELDVNERKIKNLPVPTLDSDPATKGYTDERIAEAIDCPVKHISGEYYVDSTDIYESKILITDSTGETIIVLPETNESDICQGELTIVKDTTAIVIIVPFEDETIADAFPGQPFTSINNMPPGFETKGHTITLKLCKYKHFFILSHWSLWQRYEV